jgi:hypothetical protein
MELHIILNLLLHQPVTDIKKYFCVLLWFTIRLFILPSMHTTDFESNKVYYSQFNLQPVLELWFHRQEGLFHYIYT